eukprot:TRINITY_DN6625_c0_g1_i2.p3 TRINITY_DN6625_c0_g1~~TRINITY_DN6625_c0_g1_i2.p3  ORF type:complete len:216 (-),score=39.28 TRINITY_DN6625_c0_g1_i2:101-748(-)
MDNKQIAEDKYDYLFKIVLVGDTGVGKTNLLARYVKGELPKNPEPTIGVSFATKTVTLKSGQKVKTQIWDTAGQERYRSITASHYRRAVGALLVYDVTKEKTFQNVSKWIDDLKQQAESDIVIILVGNKYDQIEKNSSNCKVQREDALKFAKQNGLLFEETSALTDYNVTQVFESLLNEICHNKNIRSDDQQSKQQILNPTINSNSDNQQSNCSC